MSKELLMVVIIIFVIELLPISLIFTKIGEKEWFIYGYPLYAITCSLLINCLVLSALL